MNHDVLPSFEAARGRIEVVFSDNGREFCGRPDRHPTSCTGSSRRSNTAPRRSTPAVERHRGTVPPHAARRTLPGRRPPHLVRDHRRDASRAGQVPCCLQSQATVPRSAHERTHPLARILGGSAASHEDEPQGRTGGTKGRMSDPPSPIAGTGAALSGDHHLCTDSCVKSGTVLPGDRLPQTHPKATLLLLTSICPSQYPFLPMHVELPSCTSRAS